MYKKYCDNCGNEIFDNDKFCGKCGSSLLDSGSKQDVGVLNETTKDTATQEIIFSILIFILYIGAIVSIFFVPGITFALLFFSLVLSVAGIVKFKGNWLFKFFLILSIVFIIVYIVYFIFIFYLYAAACSSCWQTCAGSSV